ncbi:BshB3 potential contributor to bacillithiol synthesis [Sinobaca sp. H24]|uniref:BshB3 potential contributor to bacillithiol synthesis n=1 Tax=Sinobaca sp. H24 TaxID=2923376 RepID=UPI002079F97A|nr:BshB3 potential contributor to bacillithiol synthesis [Sinobaca sp. H24]
MNIAIIFVILIGIAAVAITLGLTKITDEEDKKYDSGKSTSNMLVLYIIILPILVILVGIAASMAVFS